ncbi:MAG: GMP/IMP nucleotidase [Acidiferrobacterales bacterium]
MIRWQQVNTVLLDMDGTLLDLHYDNHFWLEHVPRRYAQRHGVSYEEAKARLMRRYREVEGTLDWYCVDFWSQQLGLDVPLLKQEVEHLIAVHPHVIDFLQAVRALGKRTVLVTNAHGKVLKLKMHRTKLGPHFDTMICAHDLGTPKEQVAFWQKMQDIEPFERISTVLIDDSLPVLKSARAYGIDQLVTVLKPDSRRPEKEVEEFPAIGSFKDIMPASLE